MDCLGIRVEPLNSDSNMSTVRRAHGHKYTAECPNPKCNYTSKIPETNFYLNNKNSVHSQFCPKHRLKLERVK